MTISKESALAFSYTLLGYLQAQHELINIELRKMDFEDSFGYKFIIKIIDYIKGDESSKNTN